MTFAELLAEVIIWSKRPDLVAASGSAIRRCTLKYHRREYWFKDLDTIQLVNPDVNSPVAILDLTAIPRFRKLASVNITGYTKPLEPLGIDEMLDKDGFARTGVYLVAGTNLNIKWSAGFPTADLVYYKDPIPTEAGFTSWIADEYPDLIACGAAAEILAFDNESEIYKAAKQAEAEQWAILKENNLEVEAR